MFDETKPIFMQLAEALADDVLRGNYAVGDQVPSTNELAAFHRINPATAGKALNLLVDEGILEKRRGLGMFVAEGARETLQGSRNEQFVTDFMLPMLREARTLGIDLQQLIALIQKEASRESRA